MIGVYDGFLYAEVRKATSDLPKPDAVRLLTQSWSHHFGEGRLPAHVGSDQWLEATYRKVEARAEPPEFSTLYSRRIRRKIKAQTRSVMAHTTSHHDVCFSREAAA